MRYLLDTNTCIAAMRQHAGVLAHLQSLSPRDCAISTITSYELFTGVAKCANPAQEQSKVDLLLATMAELPFSADAARETARIRADLESRGVSIGPYDLLLAGQAIAAGLMLVTHNTSEFARVTALSLEDWQ
jgi:tRNA(fMet)-specific endonuclease VapC